MTAENNRIAQPDITPCLKVNIGALTLNNPVMAASGTFGYALNNPVMAASGTFGYAREFEELVDLNRIGAIIVKGLSLLPERGNKPPRIVETPSGMLNAIGLENVGIERFENEKLPFLRTLTVPIIVNIYGKTVDEYEKLTSRLDQLEGISGIEINISCPNVKAGGVAFGVDPHSVYTVVHAVRVKTSLPVMVKLTPNVTDITLIARSAEDGGADAVSLINTLTGMAIDVDTRQPKLANITGGLSGPAIKPVALRMVWQVVRAVDIPVVGIGGIMCARDALEFLIAGATAVQVGTANFVNPHATMDIIDGIEKFMIEKQVENIAEIINSLIV
jgi:dihydroorotate dehydrogenase (NAD+) catalytic subunit